MEEGKKRGRRDVEGEMQKGREVWFKKGIGKFRNSKEKIEMLRLRR